jgi:adenylosuccinate synthase
VSTASARHTCVVGLGWGDEGKGKIVDWLTDDFDVVIRYNGGANAGHTVCIGGEKFAVHLVPSGVLHEGVIGLIGPGVVLDPSAVIEEIDGLVARGVRIEGNLRISDRAHLVMPYHKIEDQLREAAVSGKQRIGTTARGIGPCYAEKMHRICALRACDLLKIDHRLRERVQAVVRNKCTAFTALYGEDGGLDPDTVWQDLTAAADRLKTHICDTTRYLQDAIDQGKRLLFEGANGTLLDIDHGTYPFVTSSSTGPYGVAGGAGVPPSTVGRVIGVCKAYATRVGAGPFVTELNDAVGDEIRERGHEYGTTTGRPRRCGWFDAVATRYSVRLGGVGEIAMMHLDTLGGMERVGLCTGYELQGKPLDGPPADAEALTRARPVYDYMPGWAGGCDGISRFDKLPREAQAYVKRIEQEVGVPVTVVSVGPDRSQTIVRTP